MKAERASAGFRKRISTLNSDLLAAQIRQLLDLGIILHDNPFTIWAKGVVGHIAGHGVIGRLGENWWCFSHIGNIDGPGIEGLHHRQASGEFGPLDRGSLELELFFVDPFRFQGDQDGDGFLEADAHRAGQIAASGGHNAG